MKNSWGISSGRNEYRPSCSCTDRDRRLCGDVLDDIFGHGEVDQLNVGLGRDLYQVGQKRLEM